MNSTRMQTSKYEDLLVYIAQASKGAYLGCHAPWPFASLPLLDSYAQPSDALLSNFFLMPRNREPHIPLSPTKLIFPSNTLRIRRFKHISSTHQNTSIHFFICQLHHRSRVISFGQADPHEIPPLPALDMRS